MTQPTTTNPHTMPPSEWRLWCCCHPTVTPPPTTSSSRTANISLEEFDPRNRLSTSRAYGPHTPPPPPLSPAPSTSSPTRPLEPKRPAVAARLPALTPRAQQQQQQRVGERLGDEERARQRPDTILLPSPPHRPSLAQEGKVAKAEQRKPRFLRQDSDGSNQWWQVGRRMLERREKDGASPRREGGERK